MGDAHRALGIEVPPALSVSWRRWLAPEVQPFFVRTRRGWPDRASLGLVPSMSDELAHTYRTWRLDRALEVVWLDEEAFSTMEVERRAELVRTQVEHGRGAVPSVRRWADLVDRTTAQAQTGGGRFVWWPSLLEARPGAILARVASRAPDGMAPEAPASRHADVGDAVWAACQDLLPGARSLAGTFPPSSGPNCFGAVLSASGVADASRCVVEAEFEGWLGAACHPLARGTRNDTVGTVLVWRAESRRAVHAAVTIGGGWALEKGSAEWWTPHAIRRTDDVIRTGRAPGQRLERHVLRGA